MVVTARAWAGEEAVMCKPDSYAMRAECERLDREAALLERHAAERRDSAAREQGFGTLMFARYMDTADAHDKEAAYLRDRARQFRRAADYIYETEEKPR